MRRSLRLGLVLTVSCVLLGSGCGDGGSPTSPPASAIAPPLELRSITPARGSTLPRGQDVAIEAVLGYAIPADSGNLAVVSIAVAESNIVFLDAGTVRKLTSRTGEVRVPLNYRFSDAAAGRNLSVTFSVRAAGDSKDAGTLTVAYQIAP